MVGNLGQAAAAGAMALKGFLFSLSEIDFQGGIALLEIVKVLMGAFNGTTASMRSLWS